MEHTQNALIEIIGATCTSCSIAVEHMGQKLDGIHDIWMDRANSKIHIDYDGNKEVLDRICEFIRQIGYQASIVES